MEGRQVLYGQHSALSQHGCQCFPQSLHERRALTKGEKKKTSTRDLISHVRKLAGTEERENKRRIAYLMEIYKMIVDTVVFEHIQSIDNGVPSG